MDPNLHQTQGLNHVARVLAYAPFVAENGAATVHLTREDWQVVYDTFFAMHTPQELWPQTVEAIDLANENRAIRLTTPGLVIDVEAM